MSVLLAVSTSSARGTVAVVGGDHVIARVAYDGGTAHAERLFAAIDDVMAQAGAARADLTAIACDVGPGSFTGVRVGVASCQGVAVGLGVPAVGVGSLEAMAWAARSLVARDVAVLAVLDARKGEVFAAIHGAHGSAIWGPLHLPRERAPAIGAAVGEHAPGALVVGSIVAELEGLGAIAAGTTLRDPSVDLPDAAAIGRLAALRLASGAAASFDASRLEPVYVRAPDARPMADAPPDEGPV